MLGALVIGFIMGITAQPVAADELLFIKISTPNEQVTSLTLDPQEAVIEKGTIVYWVNSAPAEVAVVFAEGKRCEDVTEIPDRFNPDFDACYLTDFLPRYETSRLKFTETGTFNYDVRTEAGVKAVGTITVK